MHEKKCTLREIKYSDLSPPDWALYAYYRLGKMSNDFKNGWPFGHFAQQTAKLAHKLFLLS